MTIIKHHNALDAIAVCNCHTTMLWMLLLFVTVTEEISNGKLKCDFNQCEQRDGRQHRRIYHVGSFLPEESEDDDGA